VGYNITGRQNVIQVVASVPDSSFAAILSFTPTKLVVGTGGTVGFSNGSQADSIDVVFDDSTAVLGAFGGSAGNIPLFATDTTSSDLNIRTGFAFRKFPTAGTYVYHSRKYGTRGTIIVSDGP
jgi:hypothetical protein